MKTRKRENRRQFWTNDEENEAIEKKMTQIGISNFGAFARRMLISGLIVKTDMTAFNEISRDISGMTKNINQIAKKVNATNKVLKADMDRIEKTQKEIWQLLKSIESTLH